MDPVRVTLLTCSAILLASCSSGVAAPRETGTAAEIDAETGVEVEEALDPGTEPITVEAVTDPSSAVSSTIGTEGGELSLVSPDGTRFTLLVPPQAIREPTVITMTPVTSMEGVPYGEGSPMAVELGPSGLAFFDFVTLTVEPGEETPVDQLIPVATSGDEGFLELPFAGIEAGVLQLKLLHFSSAGATKGYLADTEPYRQRLGGDVEARLQSITARELLYYQQRGEPVPASFWEWLKRTWWENVMKPRLDAAGSSCAAGRLAIETAVRFERQSQLLGFAEDASSLVQQVLDLMPEVTRKCLQEEYELCRDEHIVHRMIPVLMTEARDAQLMGSAEGMGDAMAAALAEGFELARRCLHFELVFESSVEVTTAEYIATSEVESKVPIQLEGSPPAWDLILTGSSALENTTFTIQPRNACSADPIRGGSTLLIDSLNWDAAPPDPSHPYGYVTDIQMLYSPGPSTESFVLKCPRTSELTLPVGAWWAAFAPLHEGEIQDWAAPTFVSSKWEMRWGELFAVKEWERSETYDGEITSSEAGSFELYHRPR